ECGVSSASNHKYEDNGYANPKLFVKLHPAGISLATGVSVLTVCKHQKLVADHLGLTKPDTITKQAYDQGIDSLKKLNIDITDMISLACIGVYNINQLKDIDVPSISNQTNIDPKKLATYKNKANKMCK
ncbi:MAG TPA: hypothetical protein O0X99_02375, partial [Methanocorpusculum sp.]|nr:hypothetical protein [Methanocorpusculum sp.]